MGLDVGPVGISVGSSEGPDCNTVGIVDGALVGNLDGLMVGDGVGDLLGNTLGTTVVGPNVGFVEGADVDCVFETFVKNTNPPPLKS